jgi:hypothetical protein
MGLERMGWMNRETREMSRKIFQPQSRQHTDDGRHNIPTVK